jgi:uncharacterized protein YigA (DUF484 family)
MQMTMTIPTSTQITAADVLQFLQENPDFLAKYPEIIAAAKQSAGENVVDFQQMIVQKLRSEKQRVEDRQRLLIDSARSNLTVQARVHAAVVRLAESRNLEELVDIINSELALMLEVDVIAILIEAEIGADLRHIPSHGIRTVDPRFIDNHLGAERDSLLEANVAGDPRLFGPASRLVKSQALMRLNIALNVPDGLLAFGSRDPLLFADGQGTELVAFLTDVVERLLRRFMDAPR